MMIKGDENNIKGQAEDTNQNIEVNTIEESDEKYDLTKFEPAKVTHDCKKRTTKGAMAIVNAKTGKRIAFGKELMDRLDNPDKISISYSSDSIAVGKVLPNNNNLFTISRSGKKAIIYSAQLILDITEKYQLDFTEKTSITFTEVEYVENSGYKVAIIKM